MAHASEPARFRLPGFDTAGDDRDDTLMAELHAPVPLAEARSSLEFWRRRRATLPLMRVSARREARAMVAIWEQRVRDAELARLPAPAQWAVSLVRAFRPGVPRRLIRAGGMGIVFVAVTWTLLVLAILSALT